MMASSNDGTTSLKIDVGAKNHQEDPTKGEGLVDCNSKRLKFSLHNSNQSNISNDSLYDTVAKQFSKIAVTNANLIVVTHSTSTGKFLKPKS